MKLPVESSQIPTVCRMLRTKQSYVEYSADEEAPAWQLGDSTTAAFWCLQTMGPAGPDNAFVHPHHCLQGRPCFESHPD